jgi:hypothetical protein
MSCVHDECSQGRVECHREACQAEESVKLPTAMTVLLWSTFGPIGAIALVELFAGLLP